MSGCRWRWASASDPARSSAGAFGAATGSPLAIIELEGDVASALTRLGVPPMHAGAIRLVRWEGVDELVLARVSDDRALLFPHAGPATLRAVAERLERAGVVERDARDEALGHTRKPSCDSVQPEQQQSGRAWATWVDEQLCAALSTLRSARGVDVLLDHAQRARERGPSSPRVSPEHARALRRLLVAPTIAAIGPPNVGKSSLLNALAQRRVSIVADEPGTTRDHVGVRLNLAGLEVQYVDCPGWRMEARAPQTEIDRIEHAAELASRHVAQSADLVLSCGDPVSGFLPESRLRNVCASVGFADDTSRKTGATHAHSPLAPPHTLRVLLRADLGPQSPTPTGSGRHEPVDIRTSVHRGEGLEALVSKVVSHLVPEAALSDSGVWAFWDV